MTSPKLKRESGKIWSHVRKKWLVETPEERVRQEYLLVLISEYGYSLEQIDEELSVTGRGSGNARADFVIWKTPEDKADKKAPLIVVECKSDTITISSKDYHQGDNYARICGAKFVVTHNSIETRFWRVRKDRMPGYLEEIENIPHVDATDQEIEKLISELRVFRENEFADLLHSCHNVIRNREHLDPAAAFDEIAKLLFLKTTLERRWKAGRARRNLFTAEFLDDQTQIHDDPVNVLFGQTKKDYSIDKIFPEDEKINLKFNTTRQIVQLLEKYNLSDTNEDVKGIAFERFLGRTFRGEIGQFFTPRTIVEFMVQMIDPVEKDVACDPASGSGGFLIRFFEIVRNRILESADAEYKAYQEEVNSMKLSKAKRAELLTKRFERLQRAIDPKRKGSRTFQLANDCIYGMDANDRMARTSKMNMIMHGDGHGGVYHQNGFVNVNGIFEGRFDVILCNPPFGSKIESDERLLKADVEVSREDYEANSKRFGDAYREAYERWKAAAGRSILSVYELPQSPTSPFKTELLFLERCLNLLAPGGRLGIVIPEGIASNPNPTDERVREFCEDQGRIEAVISLPKDTFKSCGADVRTSLLFMTKFTSKEKKAFDEIRVTAIAEVEKKYETEIEAELAQIDELVASATSASSKREAQSKRREYVKRMTILKKIESRRLLRQRFDYPVFIYEATRVGITPTGEEDQNELICSDDSVDRSCIEIYDEFRKDKPSFSASTAPNLDSLKSPFLIVPWLAMDRWDVKSARASRYRAANPTFVPLAEFLEEATELVSPAGEPDTVWAFYGVGNREGVFLSETKRGVEFTSNCKRIRKDWFFHNPTRANVGSLGRVPDVPENAITSTEYQVWKIKKGLIPEFVEVLLRTQFFLDLVAIHRTGAVKERLYVSNLLEIPIPVLTEDQQKQTVKNWKRAQAALKKAKEKVAQTVDELQKEFDAECS